MGSTFSGLSIGISGLYANKRSLDTISHNISNANNPYYVRQQVIQSDSRTSQIPGSGFRMGTGVNVQEIRQIRDEFLDIRLRTQNESLGYWGARDSIFEQVQEIFNETSDSGVQKVMDQLWNSWNEVAKNPDNLTTRGLLKERAIAFTETVNHMSKQLDMLQLNLNNDIKNSVDEINNIANQIGKLNSQIMKAESLGQKANDYRDMRNNLVDQLSSLVNIEYYEDNTSSVNVSVGGKSLVHSTNVNEMTAQNVGSSYVDIYWKDTMSTSDPLKVNIKSGELLGLIEGRGNVDTILNNTTLDNLQEIIPAMKQKLNEFVNTIAEAINDVHSQGYTLTGEQGGDFFVAMNPSLPLQAGNIMINPDLNTLNNIAASSVSGESGNGKIAEDIVSLREQYLFDGKLNADDYYRDIISSLGVAANEAIVMKDSQEIVKGQIEDKKNSLSSVSLDEEMAEMVKYQHSYVANSRLINAIDEMADNIINRMGIVGR